MTEYKSVKHAQISGTDICINEMKPDPQLGTQLLWFENEWDNWKVLSSQVRKYSDSTPSHLFKS